MLKTPRKFYIILFLICLLLSLLLYQSSLNYYFFQDDFFEINISRAQNLEEILNFFKFRNDIIAYRPISLQSYFFISYNLFGLNPTGFRFITYLFFILSAFLIARVVTKLTHNINVGLLTASLWATSSIHFMTLTWIAASYNVIGTFFWLSTALFFLKFQENRKIIFYLLSIISYLVTVGSYEFSTTWPAIFGFYYFYVRKNSLTRSLQIFLPFILISAIYLIARMFLIKIPQIPEYQTTLNLDSAKALFWYLLWSFNIPEEFKKQIVNNILVFNSKFLSEFWPLITQTFIGAIWVATLGLAIPLFEIIKKGLKVSIRLITFTLVWFAAGILPVLLLPNHTFSMYLTLASIGIYTLIAYFLEISQKKIFIIPFLLIWLATCAITLKFYRSNSWMVEAQRFSKEFAISIKKQHPVLPPGSIVYFQHPDKRHVQALSDQHAIRSIYNDQSVSIYYNKESLMDRIGRDSAGLIYIFSIE